MSGKNGNRLIGDNCRTRYVISIVRAISFNPIALSALKSDIIRMQSPIGIFSRIYADMPARSISIRYDGNAGISKGSNDQKKAAGILCLEWLSGAIGRIIKIRGNYVILSQSRSR